MRILLNSVDADFSDLDDIHPMACVAWDRDGISDVLSRIAPLTKSPTNETTGHVGPWPRLYLLHNDPMNRWVSHGLKHVTGDRILSLYYGNYAYPLAYLMSEGRWDLQLLAVEAAVALDAFTCSNLNCYS